MAMIFNELETPILQYFPIEDNHGYVWILSLLQLTRIPLAHMNLDLSNH
jgi:hypothetical protein